jgi:hypothetical protein
MKDYKLMIKATFSNSVHKIIANPGDKKINYHKLQSDLKSLSKEQKAVMLDSVLTEYFKISNTLRAAMSKRRDKNRIEKLRKAKQTQEAAA